MLKIDAEMIGDIKALASQAPGPYMRLISWLDKNFNELNTILIHLDPPENDVNFGKRFHYRRGFVASLDAFRHILANPDDLLPNEKMEEVLPENNAF